MSQLPDLNHLSHAEKDALIHALWAQVQGLLARVTALEAKLGEPSKTSDNSSLPPSKGQKPNKPEKVKRIGPRIGSLGRKGGGRPLACDPDETVTARPAACAHCQSAFTDADQVLHGRYDKIDLPVVRPMVTRAERYAGHCRCCGGITLAAIPAGLEDGSPFSVNIVALALYLRFTHAISYRRLTQLFSNLYALQISEGALDAMLQRAKPCFDTEVAAILARLRRSRIVCSDETSVRIDGRTHWNWVFQNDRVVIHVVRNSRATSVVTEVMAGHRPSIWVSDLYGAQQGHADLWQACLAHQLRDCKYAIEAGDTIFAPRMKALLLRAVVLARRRKTLAASTRRTYQRRLDHELNAIMVLAPTNRDGRRLRKRYGKIRNSLFTFLEHPDVPPDNNGSERELRPTATYRKVTGGIPVEMGRRSIRRLSIRRWHRGETGNQCISSYSCSPRREICPSAGLSKYEPGELPWRLAQQFDVHPNQISDWKARLLEGAAGLFGSDTSRSDAPPPADLTVLHAKIGELTLEKDFLAGALSKAGLLSAKR